MGRYDVFVYFIEFCTEWPAALSDDDQCKQHFPIELKSMDYVFAGPSIRNPEARVVTLQVSETACSFRLSKPQQDA